MTDSLPAPLHVPVQHFWSRHPPEVFRHQTGYPSTLGSALAAYHSLCVLVSTYTQGKEEISTSGVANEIYSWKKSLKNLWNHLDMDQ